MNWSKTTNYWQFQGKFHFENLLEFHSSSHRKSLQQVYYAIFVIDNTFIQFLSLNTFVWWFGHKDTNITEYFFSKFRNRENDAYLTSLWNTFDTDSILKSFFGWDF